MRQNDSGESPQRLHSRGPSATGSSRIKISTSEKFRKAIPKHPTSILHRRQTMKVTDNGDDVTPKLLFHNEYSAMEDKQLTVFDTLGGSLNGSNTFLNVVSSVVGGLRISTSNVVSASHHMALLGGDDIHVDSLLATQRTDEPDLEEERAPSQFHLPRCDSDILYVKPDKVTIILKETETFFIFEMPQLTEDQRTPEGAAVLAENERYKYITVGAGSNRKLADAETQTPQVHTKPRGTYLGRNMRRNQGTFVSNWEMSDTYQSLETMEEVNGLLYPRSAKSKKRVEHQGVSHKFPKVENQADVLSIDDQLHCIYLKPSFREATHVMLRILASNLYITAQKRFTGLIKQDPYAMNLEFTYSLDLLWTFSSVMVQGRPVTCFCWSYENPNVLAVGYGALKSSEVKDGILVLWCAKNPSYPGRNYFFDSPISSLDWSKEKPNLLATGFYDGTVRVIDVTGKETMVVQQSQRKTSPTYEPHWQVQWWSGDDHFDQQEFIYTSNQDGRVFCYRTGEDFICMEVMKVARIEGKIEGVKKTVHGIFYDVPISRNPGALVLRKHPTLNSIYFVGTDEGCVHRCSTNYLHQHIDSFLAHDGPIYSMEFSPYCPKIFLTAGADWCTRIWADGIMEPLITLSTKMAWVRSATWCPTNSTIIATIVNNEICIWDIKRKTYKPTSITILPKESTLLLLEFTKNGNQLVAADSREPHGPMFAQLHVL
ncbi:WD repeat-containing protein 78-like isoform X2 [Belonocnema kinseyi]|uniref:WD repeat-containing protein 78-like isoform X2 n=1 Tax=Belonocnema kinseyi TaxID=2817044 RepID=UPI00143DD031|nr:WD repeat-containing protein 78-like isoform X2 [Belonocnema kinseyi]